MAILSASRIQSEFAAGDAATTTTKKGAALEEITSYILRRISGVRHYRSNVITTAGSEEIDVVFWNDRVPDGLPFLCNILIFECKNWSNPVSSANVSSFIQKLRSRHLEYGFLIASNGITGNQQDLTHAHRHVDDAFLQDNIKLIVVKRTELESLTDTDQFVRLIQEKLCSLTLRVKSF